MEVYYLKILLDQIFENCMDIHAWLSVCILESKLMLYVLILDLKLKSGACPSKVQKTTVNSEK